MRSIQEITLQGLTLQGNQSFLEVGCGRGALTLLVKAKYPDATVLGSDISSRKLKDAQKKASTQKCDIPFFEASITSLPFSSDSLDTVASVPVFHHLTPQIREQALMEIYRVLKPNGRFFLVDVGKPKSTLEKVFLGIAGISEPKEFRRYLKDTSEGAVVSLIHDIGFSVEEFSPSHLSAQFLLCRKSPVGK